MYLFAYCCAVGCGYARWLISLMGVGVIWSVLFIGSILVIVLLFNFVLIFCVYVIVLFICLFWVCYGVLIVFGFLVI